MPERKIAISVRNLAKSFDGRPVLTDINLDIYQGETFVIMGGSGCGKSTLAKLIQGFYMPTGGRILLDLNYEEDVDAEVDMNVVMTASGRFVEVQGTAEAEPFAETQLRKMLQLARRGIRELLDAQGKALGE